MNTFGIQAAGPRRFAVLAVAALTFSCIIILTPIGARLEMELGLTWLYYARGPVTPPSNIVLVKLDEWSANALGVTVERWPRTVHACLIDHLARLQPALIVMDIDFQDMAVNEGGADTDSPAGQFAPFVASACDLRSGGAGSLQLGASISAAGNVLLVSRLGRSDADARSAALQLRWESMPDPRVAGGALGIAPFPLPESGQRVNQFWTFYPLTRTDGDASREIPTLASVAVQALHRDSLPALLAALGRGGPAAADASTTGAGRLRSTIERIRHAVRTDAAARESIRHYRDGVGELYTGQAARFLNLFGPPGSLAEIDYGAILNSGVNGDLAARIGGKVVFVGAAEHTTNSRIDSYFTSYPTAPGRKYGGVELVATAFANLRDATTLEVLSGWQAVLLLVVIGVVLAAAGWRWDPLRVLPAVAVFIALYLLGAQALFAEADLWLPVITPVLIEIPMLMLGATLLQYLHSRATWKQILEIAEKYVSRRALAFHPAAQLVYGTMLATDAANFTKVVESFGPDPRRLLPFLSEYFDAISGPIEAAEPEGTIIDTAGDGMLAVWAATADSRELREAACLAACGIRGEVERFNRERPATALPTRIGMHAGSLALGDVEARHRRFFKAVGDVTNTASRIEGLNKRLGTSVLASDTVVAGLEHAFLLRPCGRFQLPGKQQALAVFEIMGPIAAVTGEQRILRTVFSDAMRLFEGRQWAEARTAFAAILEQFPGDGPSLFYCLWCDKYHAHPPPASDAVVIVLETK